MYDRGEAHMRFPSLLRIDVVRLRCGTGSEVYFQFRTTVAAFRYSSNQAPKSIWRR